MQRKDSLASLFLLETPNSCFQNIVERYKAEKLLRIPACNYGKTSEACLGHPIHDGREGFIQIGLDGIRSDHVCNPSAGNFDRLLFYVLPNVRSCQDTHEMTFAIGNRIQTLS